MTTTSAAVVLIDYFTDMQALAVVVAVAVAVAVGAVVVVVVLVVVAVVGVAVVAVVGVGGGGGVWVVGVGGWVVWVGGWVGGCRWVPVGGGGGGGGGGGRGGGGGSGGFGADVASTCASGIRGGSDAGFEGWRLVPAVSGILAFVVDVFGVVLWAPFWHWYPSKQSDSHAAVTRILVSSFSPFLWSVAWSTPPFHNNSA